MSPPLNGCVRYVAILEQLNISAASITDYRAQAHDTYLDTPWMTDMAPSTPKSPGKSSSETKSQDPNPPTFASFSPTPTFTSPTTRQRSTILVNRKSPLLVATPPSVTRALAFSHPFVLPANKLAGLLSWSSGDPWESFLLVAAFWAIVLYGDTVISWTGPILAVVVLILGMYSRRYSPLSSTGWTGEKQKGHEKKSSESSSMRHQKSLDEIIDTLVTMTSRCNTLLEPFMQLTDYLSTQRTATSATTRPALTTLFIRILLVTPIWILMTIPPIRLITTRRVVLAVGTLFLTWHSRPARVFRIILWRSNRIRRLASLITGLELSKARSPPSTGDVPPPLPPRPQNQHDVANAFVVKGGVQSSGVRFTFVVFENQRRWLGLGWTSSLFSYERAAWTDEHLNPSDSKEKFALPEVNNKSAEWRWAPDSEWQVEGSGKSRASAENDGWIYYDNKVSVS